MHRDVIPVFPCKSLNNKRLAILLPGMEASEVWVHRQVGAELASKETQVRVRGATMPATKFPEARRYSKGGERENP